MVTMRLVTWGIANTFGSLIKNLIPWITLLPDECPCNCQIWRALLLILRSTRLDISCISFNTFQVQAVKLFSIFTLLLFIIHFFFMNALTFCMWLHVLFIVIFSEFCYTKMASQKLIPQRINQKPNVTSASFPVIEFWGFFFLMVSKHWYCSYYNPWHYHSYIVIRILAVIRNLKPVWTSRKRVNR